MVFSSLVFLLRFLPVTLLLYFAVPGMKAKNAVLIAASLIFYAWGEPVWVILLIISSVIDYICGGLAGRHSGTPKGKLFVIISLVLNLGLLGFQIRRVYREQPECPVQAQHTGSGVSLPIGISFYTMQTISYTIDAYRGRAKVQGVVCQVPFSCR